MDNSQLITVTMEPGAERRLREEREKWEKKCQEQKARQNNQPITICDLTGITDPSRNGSVASEPKPVLILMFTVLKMPVDLVRELQNK